MSATARIALIAALTDSRDTDFSVLRDVPKLDLTKSFADGTGVDQIKAIWTDQRTLAATTETLDLAGGLTDRFGGTITFTKIKYILVHNRNTTAGHTLKIGGNASNAFLLFTDATDKYTLGPGGTFCVIEPSAAGLAVTAATGDILKFDAGANTIVYDIMIAGVV